ncbi:MAG TPA: hypothetical protein P5205_13215 [Candidatus Paceibacterota bacterium]|nr:hypothetical protein [Verrucomicrobiota bacterium]HSA11321.1 hypothetical protein [Candidatus Paceibacterota bacterium]
MNDKLRDFFHTTWTEPRHFFFWLAMLSIAGFVAVAVGAALAGPFLLLAFVALGCIVCFVVSVPAFILAWIPPFRRFCAWLLARKLLVLSSLITLVVLLYAVENWRGRQAWRSFKQAREAKGERFDLASFTPPPVPDSQNFFETPLWSDLRFVQTNGRVVWSNTNRRDRAFFDIYGPGSNRHPDLGNWAVSQRVNLVAWQGYYRGNSNKVDEAAMLSRDEAFRRRYGLLPDGVLPEPAPVSGPPTNYFPSAKEPQTPAADVLLALSRFETNRQLLIASAARPQARFWVNYEAGFGMLLPHLARLRGTVQYLSLHATAALKAGDRQTALEDLRLAFRLMAVIRAEPNLIAQLVRMAMLQFALQPVWEGLADRQWTAADLSAIENELASLDLLADYQFAMRGERACGIWAADYIHRVGIQGLDEMGISNYNTSGPSEWERSLGQAVFRLIPAGWFNQNKVSVCRQFETYLLPAVDRERRIVPPGPVQKAQAALEAQRPRPYDAVSRLFLPAVAGCAQRFARGQISSDLARVACALERSRLANGSFPEALDGLVPRLIETLPHDIINGGPLKYRRTDDGQFVLYSVGWNESDDGGVVEQTKNGNPVLDKNDWVWRYAGK